MIERGCKFVLRILGYNESAHDAVYHAIVRPPYPPQTVWEAFGPLEDQMTPLIIQGQGTPIHPSIHSFMATLC